MIELIVGLTIFLILMTGFVPVFAQGLAQSTTARYRSAATNIAREKVEQIRQLDYREIIEDTDDPTNPLNLSNRFGTSVTIPERNMTFTVSYEVASEALPGEAIKSVQVTVTWAAPPAPVSPAVVKTMVAQQYLGPRAASLEVTNTTKDDAVTLPPGGTPFPVLNTTGLNTVLKFHMAESDWFMAYDTLSLPLPSPNNISLEYYFRDDAGGKVCETRVDNTGLKHTEEGSPAAVSDIWFEDSFDARTVPDGYWDLRVTMLNIFEEPGNTWTLRVRVEKGAPETPALTAISADDHTVLLTWTPGAERDRAYYVLQRREVNAVRNPMPSPDGDWVNVTVDPPADGVPSDTLPANTTSFTDEGSLDPSDPNLDVDPSGRPALKRYYEYRLYGVDTGGRYVEPDSSLYAFAMLPASSATLKVIVPSLVGLSQADAETALNTLGLGWSITEVVDAATPGTVLTQVPAAGTEVENGAIIALTVAKAATPPAAKYTVTISTKNKTSRTIVVLDESTTPVFTGAIVKNDDVVLSLSNGHYTIRLGSATGTQLGDFFVNGAKLSVEIP